MLVLFKYSTTLKAFFAQNKALSIISFGGTAKSGIHITLIPADKAALTPFSESSKTSASSGTMSFLLQARTKMSGYGLDLSAISPPITSEKNPSIPAIDIYFLIYIVFVDDAITHGIAHFFKKAKSSGIPYLTDTSPFSNKLVTRLLASELISAKG